MDPITVTFEMTDEIIAHAAREACVALGREQLKLSHILLIACSAAIFVSAVERGSHWLWWIAGAPPVLFVLLVLGWLGALWWFPRAAIRRLARLPHRHVTVEFSEPNMVFQTANERLEVSWGELKEVKALPNFWLFCLWAGAEIPVPRHLLPQEAIYLFRSKPTPQDRRVEAHG